MISMDIWVEIKALREQGVSIRKIARQLDISKVTVRQYLRQDGPPQYPARPSKLDPYAEIIHEKVEKGLSGARILRELRAAGYSGRYTILTDYIRQFRPQPEARATVRFETPPGLHYGKFRVMVRNGGDSGLLAENPRRVLVSCAT